MGVVSRIEEKLLGLSVRRHGLLVAGSVVVLGVVNAVLNASYAASGHPVSYAEGQTTFSGSEIKGFYAVMEDGGTLGRYWQTQFIDFGFIAMMIVVGGAVGLLLARLGHPGSVAARLGRLAAVVIPLGAAFDVVENLISFVMLADPQGFPEWLAVPYSAAAVVKFGLIGLGMVALIGSLIALLVGRTLRRLVGRSVDRQANGASERVFDFLAVVG